MAFGEVYYVPLNQSCFYKLSSRKKLAEILFSSPDALEAMANDDGLYSSWERPKKNGGVRQIEAPFDHLKNKQRRIAYLLQRIEPPNYLMAPVKRRSYVHNAAQHRNARAFRLLDVEDFFPSCTDKRVYWFFHKRMKCSPDVAAVLTKLTTFGGHLPQGSPCSPILAYFAYVDMWEEIHGIVSAADCCLSIYADDITISGENVYERDVWAVKQTLHRFGHRYSPNKERRVINRPVDITGTIVAGDELLLPNRQHLKMAQTRRQRHATKSPQLRRTLDRQLRGRVAQARQILNHIEKQKADQ